MRKPAPNFRRSLKASSEESTNRSTTQTIAKDYVESLHQNTRSTLIFGRNNVLVLPPKSDQTEPIPGYLGLHQEPTCLSIKWTPNYLMKVRNEEDIGIFWEDALQVVLDEIVYVHCHQDVETGETVILVGKDGVQRPPMHFPKG